jgi:hypothetical protein
MSLYSFIPDKNIALSHWLHKLTKAPKIITLVITDQRHLGLDKAILAKRHQVNEAAKLKNSSHWSGNSGDWTMIDEVNLNPEKKEAMRAT